MVLRRAQWLGSVMGPRGEHLATLADEVAELPAANRTPGVAHGPFHSYEIVADGSHAVRLSRTEAFVDHHRGLDAFLRGGGSPLARLVARLAGERVSLYKDKLNYKFPGGGGYVPHQDGYDGLGVPQYVSPAQRGFIAYVAMIAVDDTTLSNGCAQVAPATWARKEGWLDFIARATTPRLTTWARTSPWSWRLATCSSTTTSCRTCPSPTSLARSGARSSPSTTAPSRRRATCVGSTTSSRPGAAEHEGGPAARTSITPASLPDRPASWGRRGQPHGPNIAGGVHCVRTSPSEVVSDPHVSG